MGRTRTKNSLVVRSEELSDDKKRAQDRKNAADAALNTYGPLTPDKLAVTALQDKFEAIAALQGLILHECKAPEDDPYQHIDEALFPDEIELMVRLSESMRHSEYYHEWLDLCRDYLFTRLYEDRQLGRIIRRWDSIGTNQKKHALRLREAHHSAAAKKTTKSNITTTNVSFMDDIEQEPKAAERKFRINGFSSGSLTGGKKSRLIRLSVHPESSFRHAATAMATGHHEKKHDIGVQQAAMYANDGMDKLGKFRHDAALWYHMKRACAVISSRINRPYRTQFHEVVAFSEGDKMKAEITSMFGLTPAP